jgi:hypothetical protein
LPGLRRRSFRTPALGGFNPNVIYRARAESNAALLPDIQIAPAGARLVFLPHRRDLSDALPRLAISGQVLESLAMVIMLQRALPAGFIAFCPNG